MKKTIEIESTAYYEFQDKFMHMGVRDTLDGILNDFGLWHKDDYRYIKTQAKVFLKMLKYTHNEAVTREQDEQEQEHYQELFENWKKFYKNKTDWRGGV